MPFATPLGGAELLLQTFLERAPSVDVEPHVVFFDHGPWPDQVRAMGFSATVVEPGRFRNIAANLRATAQLRALLRAEQPDVVFGWLSRAHVTLAPAAIAAGMRDRLAWYQWTVPAGEFIERAATLMPARSVVTCSEAGSRAQAEHWPRRPVTLAYPGIDPPRLLPEAGIAALRERLGIPAGRDIVGISGRLVRWKGQHHVVRAVGALVAEGRDVHGLIVGGTVHGLEADFEPELHALARELGIEDRIAFTGQVDDAFPYTQLMDVAVNASEAEPFGLVVLEAMALETAIVAIDGGGPREIVDDGETGILVATAAPDLLAAAIRDLLADPERRLRIARAGRAAVLERFTVDRWMRQVREGLERVLEG
jgi:glycosyltransferase involved in cell wall biosynthesis